eukprot:760963-Hanusia_phi.AAC.1
MISLSFPCSPLPLPALPPSSHRHNTSSRHGWRPPGLSRCPEVGGYRLFIRASLINYLVYDAIPVNFSVRKKPNRPPGQPGVTPGSRPVIGLSPAGSRALAPTRSRPRPCSVVTSRLPASLSTVIRGIMIDGDSG